MLVSNRSMDEREGEENERREKDKTKKKKKRVHTTITGTRSRHPTSPPIQKGPHGEPKWRKREREGESKGFWDS